ncbi:glycoside hydrolase family 13 protein [Butyrivibrio sp.]|uniref:glycoside hydrolase family 13 protein n=1 Tax=Butyrivibrio sp. TaxID=28121 RepID=UPI0025FDA561|nr:glycoside hydrolase family 13 protein [Butyrivibrio sp.]
MFDSKLLFHDISGQFVCPMEQDIFSDVTIFFRTGKDQVFKVFLCTDENEYPMSLMDEDEVREKGFEDGFDIFDYYKVIVKLGDKPFSYIFKLELGNRSNDAHAVYYDYRGAFLRKPAADNHMAFRLFPGAHVPKWSRGAVMYQIFVDRFCNGDKDNDVLTDEYHYNGGHSVQVNDWNKYPHPSESYKEFYGGDLQGVIDKLDYLKDLGVEVIYLNPVFVSPSSHKYDTMDYDHIDPHFGKIVEDEGRLLDEDITDNRKATKFVNRVTNINNLNESDLLFAKLVNEAHQRGIRVIIDGVFNHCGSFNKWLDKELIYEDGAFLSEDSPYHKWFDFKKKKWPENNTYDGWWGYDTLPKLNFEGSRSLQEYILRLGRKWVSEPFNADGWRLDVATDLGHSESFNHEFWQRFRNAVRDANPDAIILAENYGSSRNWLLGNEWDTIMNYDAFMEPVTWFLTGEEKHSDEFKKESLCNTALFWKSMKKAIGENFGNFSMYTSMNQLDNHDHSRFMTRTNMKPGRSSDPEGPQAADKGVNKGIFKEAVVMQMTWPGAPTLYYGDEAGVCGFTDPDNRRTYPWGNEDKELIDFYKNIISIHKKYPEFTDGSLVQLGKTSVRGVLSYGRFTGEAASVIILNNNNKEKEIALDLKPLGIPDNCSFDKLIQTSESGYDNNGSYEVLNRELNITLPAYSSLVIRYSKH